MCSLLWIEFSIEDQIETNKQFWYKSRKERKEFILLNTNRTKNTGNDNHIYTYYLKNIEVCAVFFNTIGYDSNSIIRDLYKSIDNQNLDSSVLVTAHIHRHSITWGNNFKRKHSQEFNNELNNTILNKNPTLSHYSRDFKPNRLYIFLIMYFLTEIYM
jgi:hypothetical protein